MEKYFNCTVTISQEKRETGKVLIEVVGRVIKKIKLGNKLFDPSTGVRTKYKIINIEFYGNEVNSLNSGMTCHLFLSSDDYLYNSTEFLEG